VKGLLQQDSDRLSLFSPSWYSLFICCHPPPALYIFSKNHNSLILPFRTSSLESTFPCRSVSLA